MNDDKKRKLIGFKVSEGVKDLITQFANSSGKSVSDVVRESTLKEIRDTKEFSFKNRLDAELNELQTKAEKQAQNEVLGKDYIPPSEFEKRIQEERAKLNRFQTKLKEADQTVTQAVKDTVAGEGSLDDVEDPTWELERKIKRAQVTISKLKELKRESEKLQNQVKDKSSEIFEKLVKTQLVRPIAEEAENVLSRLIEDLRLLDRLMNKTRIYRRSSVGWQIQSRLDKAVPFFESPFSRHPNNLKASVMEILGVD